MMIIKLTECLGIETKQEEYRFNQRNSSVCQFIEHLLTSSENSCGTSCLSLLRTSEIGSRKVFANNMFRRVTKVLHFSHRSSYPVHQAHDIFSLKNFSILNLCILQIFPFTGNSAFLSKKRKTQNLYVLKSTHLIQYI